MVASLLDYMLVIKKQIVAQAKYDPVNLHVI
jgi:hypothetical protein